MKHCPQCQQAYADDARQYTSDGAWLSLSDPYHLVGTVLADKYRLDALVGVGGMGAVYRAYHLGIERPVAVKILQPNIALNGERWLALFEREAKLAGRLIHENIANVMDAGRTADGIAYLVMEWLAGKTLQEELTAQGQLDFKRAAELLKQICAALAAAHAAGIVHRDLKPANVMLLCRAEGREQVKVLDFGIAKLAETATAVSAPLGTPHYASPEQFQAGGQIDQRADIYSLGVLLYQMLGGELPFQAASVPELIRLQMTALPPPLRKLRPETPLALEQLINRLLAKDPQQRPQDVAEIPALFEQALPNLSPSLDTLGIHDTLITQAPAAALPLPKLETNGKESVTAEQAPAQTQAMGGNTQGEAGTLRRTFAVSHSNKRTTIVGTLLIAMAVIAVYLWQARRTPKNVESAGTRRLAVLPFKPLVPGQTDEVLSLGMTDALISKLSNLRQIAVRPTGAVLKYANGKTDLATVGRELEVEMLLDGRVQRAADRIRVTVQLFDVRDGTARWAATFDERFTDIFKVQDAISEQAAMALLVQLTSAERQRLAKHITEDTEAYQLYLKARLYWEQRTQEGFKKGIDYLHQALEKDARFALAHTGLGSSYALLSMYGFLPPREAMPKAQAAALRALELDESLVEAHVTLALVHAYYAWNLPAAESELQRAFELNPNEPTAHHLYGLLLAAQGRFAEATDELQRAQRLDPRSLNIATARGWLHYLQRNYGQTRALDEEVLAQNPNFFSAVQHLGQTHERTGKYREAISLFQKARVLSGNSTFAVARLGHVYARAGQRKEALALLAELKASANRAFGVAWVYLGLAEHEQALAWLEKAAADRESELIYLKVDPIYDEMRDVPRFQALLQRVGLAR